MRTVLMTGKAAQDPCRNYLRNLQRFFLNSSLRRDRRYYVSDRPERRRQNGVFMFDESKYRNFDENFSLAGKNAIVTGASNGIGEAIAQMFIRKGANLVGFDRNPSAILEDYAKEHGIEIINLEVRSDNKAAIHLYEKYGFIKTGTVPAFFKIDKEYVDFDVMSLDMR